MIKYRKIESILEPPPPHWVGDGFRVHNFFPGGHHIGMHRMSPFFLMDYNSKFEFPPSDVPRGVSPHPHRGFETVTIAYHGKVAHHDSFGNSGIISEGDVQWMTAAAGILHKEYHEKEFSRSGGLFQMVQLWVNLPAKFKNSPAGYQALTHDSMGKFDLPANEGTVFIIAGEYQDVKGPARTFTPISLFDVRLNDGGVFNCGFPENWNTGILVIEGEVKVNDEEVVKADHFVLFENTGNDIKIEAMGESIVLVLSGEPIEEPIMQYGPFLMNTKEEIQQAIDDFRNGKFGYLEE